MNHQFDIIEYCSLENLNCSERFWQDIFNVTGRNGLNCILQNCGDDRRMYSQETRDKISTTLKSRCVNVGGKNGNAKLILCLETGIYYDSIRDVSKAYNFKMRAIERMLNENSPVINKTSLIYVDNYIEGLLVKNPEFKVSNRKKVIDVLNNKEYPSIVKAAKLLNINESTLRTKLNGRLNNNTTLKFLE